MLKKLLKDLFTDFGNDQILDVCDQEKYVPPADAVSRTVHDDSSEKYEYTHISKRNGLLVGENSFRASLMDDQFL